MFQTLAARLTLLYALLFCLLALIVFTVVSKSLEVHLVKMVDLELREEAEEFANILNVGGLSVLQEQLRLENESEDVEEAFIRIFDAERNNIFSTDLQTWPVLPDGRQPVDQVSDGWFQTLSSPVYAHAVRIYTRPLGDGYTFQMGRLMAEKGMLMAYFRRVFAATFVAVLLLGAILGFFVARSALAGLQKVREAADRISCGDMTGKITFQDRTHEINGLIHSVNHMQQKIKSLIYELQNVTNNIAHDLRSPITRMRGLAETNLTGEQTLEDYRELAGTVVEECDSLVGMINAMLEIAETDAGLREAPKMAVDLANIVDDVGGLFSTVAEDKGINLQVTVASSPLLVQGDRSRLQRVVANLLDNAIKYTPEGGKVAIRAAAEAEHILIAVADTGIGIPPEEHRTIFNRFYRLDQSRSTSGCGLGLSLIQAVVKAHGGSVWVESEIGQGSIFTIKLPRKQT
jgi:heavy metal sensor kinase